MAAADNLDGLVLGVESKRKETLWERAERTWEPEFGEGVGTLSLFLLKDFLKCFSVSLVL